MLAQDVAVAFKEAGFPLYRVGGEVRDGLLGRKNHDVDYATPMSLDQVKTVNVSNSTLVIIGESFETATFVRGTEKVDVARFRTEFGFTDNRKVLDCEFVSSIEEDLARRDFTVNAIAVNVHTGEMIDPFNGLVDLELGMLRAVRDAKERFLEDALRVLRFFRFLAVLGFDPEPETLAACGDADVLERLRLVSGERVRDELFKMLTVEDASQVTAAFKLMNEAGVLDVVLPELSALSGMPFLAEWHDVDPFEHTMYVVEASPDNDLVLRLACLLHDIGKATTVLPDVSTPGHARAGLELVKSIAKRLRFTNEMRDEVAFLVDSHMDRMADRGTLARKLKRATGSGMTTLDKAFAIRKSDVLGRGPKSRQEEADRLDALLAELKEYESTKPALNVTDLAVSGKTLIALGVEPGPKMGLILKDMLSAVLDGHVENDRDALISFYNKFYV